MTATDRQNKKYSMNSSSSPTLDQSLETESSSAWVGTAPDVGRSLKDCLGMEEWRNGGMEECLSNNSSMESTTWLGEYLELFCFIEILFIS